jgi:AraC family transcriptional regulator, alkane utilization regulator
MTSASHGPDLLSDLFAGDALKTSVIASFRMASPWGLEVPHFGPALLYAVLEGSLVLQMDGWPALDLSAGDVLLLPRGASHRASSTAETPVRHVLELFESQGVHAWTPGERAEGPIHIDVKGDGAACRFLVVLLEFQDSGPGSLRLNLPEQIHLRPAENRLAPWLQSAVESMAAGLAQGRMGYFALSTKLAELVFIDTLSTFLLLRPEAATGWLRAMSDPRLARLLAELNRRPAERWTIELMARAAGMSRSSLSATFKSLTGQTPQGYLTRARMRIAATQIASGRSSVKQTAHDLGYASEKAFGTAFKKAMGRSPGSLKPRSGPGDHRKPG